MAHADNEERTQPEGLAGYTPQQDLRFDRSDVIWLLAILPQLRLGKYPAGNTEPNREEGKAGRSERAPFENAGLLAAEVDERLDACGRDGVLLELVYTLGITTSKAATLAGERPEKLARRLETALGYIASGWCRRWISCARCLTKPNCMKAKKGRVAKNYKDWRGHR